jgi:replication factor A1
MHYALVSDLLTKEEFDKQVEKKCEELGGTIDEICAAMLVVEELGRNHIKIDEIKDTSTAFVSFFGKILEIIPPREFRRKGESEDSEPELIASLVLGDQTGTVKMTLWGKMATIVPELEVESVLEVIAKPRLGYQNEVNCVAFRPSQVTILETKKLPKSMVMKIPLTARVLHIGDVRKITRRDGSVSEFQEIFVGDPSGTARIITWKPELFTNLDEGTSVSFSGLMRKENEGSVEYVAREGVLITPHPESIEILTNDAGDVAEGRTSVVTGVVRSVSSIRTFTTHRGTELRVKNIKLGSEVGCRYVNVVCWNDATEVVVFTGDKIEIINASAKPNKYGEMELSVGNGSVLREGEIKGTYTEFEGFIVPRTEGMTIDNGVGALIIVTELPLIPATYIRARGLCKNSRLYADSVEMIRVSAINLKDQLLKL